MNRFFVQFEAFVYMNPLHSRIPAVYFETDEGRRHLSKLLGPAMGQNPLTWDSSLKKQHCAVSLLVGLIFVGIPPFLPH